MKKLTQSDVREIIKKDVEKSTLRQTARRIGISAAYLSDILKGKRDISETIAGIYGYSREVTTEVAFRKIA